MQESPRLLVSHVSKRYGETTVLTDIDLTVAPGEILALVGENGAGKSTLLRIIAGLVPPTSGEVRIDGERLRLGTPAAAMRAGIRLVHQELSVVPELTVAENLALADLEGSPQLSSYRQAVATTERFFRTVGLQLNPAALAASLSLAERSLLEIAKAIYFAPRLLLLDEPTSALSHEEVAWLFRIIRQVASRGTSVVFISHRLPEVYAIADRIAVLKDGVLMRKGTPSELTEEDVIRAMVGRELPALFPAKATLAAARSLGLQAEVARPPLLKPCRVVCRQGEIVGIGGLEGHGQHALLRALMGLLPVQGWVEIDGQRFAPNPRRAVAHGVGYVPADRQSEGLARHLSVQRNLEVVLMRRGMGVLVNHRRLVTAARAVVADLRLKTASLDEEVRRLSGGTQQKVVLGRWLMSDIRVLLLDEPTRGVDVGTKAEIYQRLRDLANQGVSILFASTDMLELIGLADRVLVMREGAIVGELVGEQIQEGKILALALGQEQAVYHAVE